MVRPVEIDRDKAFNDAYELFWSRGYIPTSLNDLLHDLGIGRSSFYSAFSSKEALFVDVLARYHEQVVEKFNRIRRTHRGVAALRAYLYQSAVNVTQVQRQKGCLAVNSTIELADVDETLHRIASETLHTIETELLAIFEECQQLGEIDSKHQPEVISKSFWIALQGLNVACRQGATRAEIKDSVDGLLMVFTT